jgi:CARDB
MKIVPTNPTTLDIIRFSAFVHNVGRATAPASKNGIKIGGETYPMIFSKPPLKIGSTWSIMRLFKLEQPGIYWVKFIADVDNDISELNENNNMVSLKFEVLKPVLPDLTVTSITNNSSNCLV